MKVVRIVYWAATGVITAVGLWFSYMVAEVEDAPGAGFGWRGDYVGNGAGSVWCWRDFGARSENWVALYGKEINCDTIGT